MVTFFWMASSCTLLVGDVFTGESLTTRIFEVVQSSLPSHVQLIALDDQLLVYKGMGDHHVSSVTSNCNSSSMRVSRDARTFPNSRAWFDVMGCSLAFSLHISKETIYGICFEGGVSDEIAELVHHRTNRRGGGLDINFIIRI